MGQGMTPFVDLPSKNGRLERYRMLGPRAWHGGKLGGKLNGDHDHRGRFDRIALAAAHVVADPLADVDPWLTAAIDWDATIAFRRHLWSLGLGVAEAMDTAQRGMGLDWGTSLELIRRSLDAARSVPGAVIACGAGTDHLAQGASIEDVIRGYE